MSFFSKVFKEAIFGKWLGGHIWSADRTNEYREYLKTDAW